MDPPPVPVIPYLSKSPPRPSRRGRGFLAICATLLLPGLGHFWAGRTRRALGVFGIAQLILAVQLALLLWPPLFPAALAFAPLGILLTIAIWIDAYRSGHQATALVPRAAWQRYLLGTALLVLTPVLCENALLAKVVRHHLAESFRIAGEAMTPTLVENDRFLVLHHRRPTRWNVVVFNPPGTTPPAIFVERVVGLPGETIFIMDGKVVINGHSVPFPLGVGPYRAPRGWDAMALATSEHPLHLADDEYFVIGDNSTRSLDSRFFRNAALGHQRGAVPAADICGVATWLFWPTNHWRYLGLP